MNPTRRDFLKVSGSCMAHIALMSACAPLAARRRWTAPEHPTVATTPFARLDLIGPDTWALVSTPLGGDRTTYSNGGIIAGGSGVIAVEGFYKPAGAEWLAQRARELTGRWPTHVVLTHYHIDHAAGLAGYASAGRGSSVAPIIRATEKTRELALGGGAVAPARDAVLARAFADIVVVDAKSADIIDLGNRRVRLNTLGGHTASDLVVVDDDAGITWGGDLLWNGMFPNFVDASPTMLADSVRQLQRSSVKTFVPGHGAVADRAAVTRYVNLLEDLERAARRGHQAGDTPAIISAAYIVPTALGAWMASKLGVERAMTAWYRELNAR